MDKSKNGSTYQRNPDELIVEVRRLRSVDFTRTEEATQEVGELFEFSQEMLAILTVDGRFHRANKAWARSLGYASGDLENRSIFDVIHPDDVPVAVEQFDSVVRGQDTVAFTSKCRDRDGRLHWIRWNLTPAPGRPYVYASACDITDHIAASEELARANEMLSAVLLSAPIAMWVTDLEGRLQLWNDAAFDTLGCPDGETMRSASPFLAGCSGSDDTGKSSVADVETPWRREDGSVRRLRIWKAPLHDECGDQVGTLGMSADITPLPR